LRPLHLWIPGAGAIPSWPGATQRTCGLYSADEGATESSTRLDDVDGQVEIMHIDRRSDMYRWPVVGGNRLGALCVDDFAVLADARPSAKSSRAMNFVLACRLSLCVIRPARSVMPAWRRIEGGRLSVRVSV
jgi:hypothetical protein